LDAAPLLKVSDVAERLGLHERTVYVLARRGEIRSVKLGYRSLRFRLEDINEYLEQHVQEPAR
jgi:excisionase family DNA binding protein